MTHLGQALRAQTTWMKFARRSLVMADFRCPPPSTTSCAYSNPTYVNQRRASHIERQSPVSKHTSDPFAFDIDLHGYLIAGRHLRTPKIKHDLVHAAEGFDHQPTSRWVRRTSVVAP